MARYRYVKLVCMPKSVSKSSTAILSDSNAKKTIKVLHVDDDVDFLRVVKQILELQDTFRVDTASSADEAMKRMQTTTYDAIVSDYHMPTKDGLRFLEELREKGNDTPFIIFTGKGREEVAIRALNLGANYYVNKNGNLETVYLELSHSIISAVKKSMKLAHTVKG
jgi:DNA-binding response OmpR family regulator